MAALKLVALFLLSPYLCAVTAVCPSCAGLDTDPNYEQVNYTESTAGLINPERGGVVILTSHSSSPTALTVSQLDELRNSHYINMIWRSWYLDSYVSSNIASSFLDHVQNDLNTVRSAGFKAVIRFAYTDVATNTTPYGDATQTWMLTHIQQLQSVITGNVDVIAAWQAGFIGIWGEWYYTTHFGDPNDGAPDADDWSNRADIVAAMLNVLPDSRLVQIRTPYQKHQVTGWITAVTLAESQSRSTNRSRIGHHNDCFLASDTDQGTYSSDNTVRDGEKEYLEQDTKYTSMGGETCAVNELRSLCPTALIELERFHWDYINLAYKEEVLTSWKIGGCFDTIMDKIGYRLSLTSAYMPKTVASGSTACIQVGFSNSGYSAPMNPREVRLLLKNGGTYYESGPLSAFTSSQPWTRETGSFTATQSIRFDVPAGDYQMLLEFSDPELRHNADYSILLHNKDVPDANIGMNYLGHTVTVTAASQSASCDGFTLRNSPTPSNKLRCYSNCDGVTFESTCLKHLIDNPSLESTRTFGSSGSGFILSTDSLRGSYSFQVGCSDGQFSQQVMLPSGTSVVTAMLWSKADSMSGTKDIDYSLYADLTMADGTFVWGLNFPFEPTTAGWQRGLLLINQGAEIASIYFYGICKSKTGFALFDEFYVHAGDLTCTTLGLSAENLCLEADDLLPNGGFEETGSWQTFPPSTGIVDYITSSFRSGEKSVDVNGGAFQIVNFPAGTFAFSLGAWSKSTNVPIGTSAANYGVYCDLTLVDNTNVWAQVIGFSSGTHDWEYRQLGVSQTTAIQSAACYIMFRNTAGKALFDDVQLWLVDQTDTLLYACPIPEEAPPSDSCSNNLISGGVMETSQGFSSFSGGFTVSSAQFHVGLKSFLVDCATSDGGGFLQTVTFTASESVQVLTITLWSYVGTTITGLPSTSDYSIYADVTYIDGTSLYGSYTRFDSSVSGWQQATLLLSLPKSIGTIHVYGLCRSASGGSAYFDEIGMFMGSVTCQG